MTAAAGRLALVPPAGRDDGMGVTGLSRAASLIDGVVPILGAKDRLGVTETWFDLIACADDISKSSRSKLAVLFLGADTPGESGTFHAPSSSIVTCPRSLGVFDNMSKTYLFAEKEKDVSRRRSGRCLASDGGLQPTHPRPIGRTVLARCI